MLHLWAGLQTKSRILPPDPLSVQTNSAINLQPTYPSSATGNFLFAHVTVHADQNISVNGTPDGWTLAGSVIVGDLGNVVLSKVAAGQSGNASIDWNGDNLTGSRVAASAIYLHECDPDSTISAAVTTQGTGTTVTFPSLTLAAGEVGLAFLSVNGIGIQSVNPSSTWAFRTAANTATGDDAAWAQYEAFTSPSNGTLVLTAGSRWSVVAFKVIPPVAPPPPAIVITRRQIKTSDTGTLTLDQVPVQGNLLVASSYHRATGSSAAISGSNWVSRVLRTANLADATNQQGMAVWAKTAGASEPTAITVTWTPASTNRLTVQELEANVAVTYAFAAEASNVAVSGGGAPVEFGGVPVTFGGIDVEF